jgi:hypothetical protein
MIAEWAQKKIEELLNMTLELELGSHIDPFLSVDYQHFDEKDTNGMR